MVVAHVSYVGRILAQRLTRTLFTDLGAVHIWHHMLGNPQLRIRVLI